MLVIGDCADVQNVILCALRVVLGSLVVASRLEGFEYTHRLFRLVFPSVGLIPGWIPWGWILLDLGGKNIRGGTLLGLPIRGAKISCHSLDCVDIDNIILRLSYVQ